MIKLLKKIGVAAFWIAVWYVAYIIVGKSVLLPSPKETAEALFVLFPQADFWISVALSLLRIISGFALGVLIGVFLGALTASFSWAKEVFSPLLSTVAATPVASFIILALVWFNTGLIPVFTAFLIVMPNICSNVNEGIRSTDIKLLDAAKAFGVRRAAIVKDIYLPSVKPYFSASVNSSAGMAWKAGIAAEVLCSPGGSIGSGLHDSKIYLDTPALFAWTSVVIILSVILNFVIKLLIRRSGREGR